MTDPSGPVFVETARTHLARAVKAALFRRIRAARSDGGLFVRAGDLAAGPVMLDGGYAPEIAAVLRRTALTGGARVLLDVGANIGLAACPVADAFETVHAFEPNPLAFKILEVNAAISAAPAAFRLHPFGIADRDGAATLSVPKGNWGGSFVRGNGNAYDDGLLAAKDGFDRFDPSRYAETEIALRRGRDVFRPILEDCGGHAAVKIDVEGFERTVLAELAAARPAAVALTIVFENWDAGADFRPDIAAFGPGGRLFALRPVGPAGGALRRGIARLAGAVTGRGGAGGMRIAPADPGAVQAGDAVLYVPAARSSAR